MAAGAIPVCGDLPSIREWIKPGQNGFLAAVDDAYAVAESLMSALRISDARRAAIRAENYRIIATRAGRAFTAQRAAEMYSRLVIDQRGEDVGSLRHGNFVVRHPNCSSARSFDLDSSCVRPGKRVVLCRIQPSLGAAVNYKSSPKRLANISSEMADHESLLRRSPVVYRGYTTRCLASLGYNLTGTPRYIAGRARIDGTGSETDYNRRRSRYII